MDLHNGKLRMLTT